MFLPQPGTSARSSLTDGKTERLLYGLVVPRLYPRGVQSPLIHELPGRHQLDRHLPEIGLKRATRERSSQAVFKWVPQSVPVNR